MSRRAKVKLDSAAVAAANKAVGNRPLHPSSPDDADARKAWMDAYLAHAGADGEDDTTCGNEPVKAVCQPCIEPWCELRYLDANGKGVAGATFHAFCDDERNKSIKEITGSFDANGFCRLDNLPIGTAYLRFCTDGDPVVRDPYEPKKSPAAWNYQELKTDWSKFPGTLTGGLPQASPTTRAATLPHAWEDLFSEELPGLEVPVPAGGVFGSPSLAAVAPVIGPEVQKLFDWWKPVLLGDWSKQEMSLGQIAVRSVITSIPLIDQAADIQDLSSSLNDLIIDEKYDDPWVWFNFVTTLVGCVPVAGSALKGVLRAFGKIGKRWVDPTLQALIRHVNHYGVLAKEAGETALAGAMNAVKWLTKKAGELTSAVKDAALSLGNRLFQSAREFLQKVQQHADGLWDELADWAKHWLSVIGEVQQRMANYFSGILTKLKERLERLIPRHKGERDYANGQTNVKNTAPENPQNTAPTRQQQAGEVGEGPRERGSRTRINSDDAPENVRALTRENESADTLAQHGYNVIQNPKVPGPKNPDYLINGHVYDNFAPSTGSARNIWSVVKSKVESGQTARIVLNLDDSSVPLDALRKQFADWKIAGLDDVIIIKNGQIFGV